MCTYVCIEKCICMYMHVQVWACLSIFTYVCMYICDVCTCVGMYISVSMCVSVCMYTSVSMCMHECTHVNAHVCKCVSMCVHCETMIPNSNFHSDSALPCFSFCLSTSLRFVLVPFNLRGSLCQPELITCTVSYFSSCLLKKFCVIESTQVTHWLSPCLLAWPPLWLVFCVPGF